MDHQSDYEIYRNLIESAPDAVLLVNDQGEIVFFNETAVNFFGYSPDEINGSMVESLIPQRFCKQHRHHRKAYHTDPQPRPMGMTLGLFALCKNGKEIPVSVSLSPVTTERGLFVVTFIRDISDLEQQIVDRTAELHQANQKLQDEIADRQQIEHDLRQLTAKLTQREAQLTNELRLLEQISDDSHSEITAGAFGLSSLERAVPETFAELIERYGELIELALEEKAYKVDNQIPEALRTLANQLGFLNAGPHDVVNLHVKALQQRSVVTTHARKKALVEEGRIIVLQTMGFLVSYYRNHHAHSHNLPVANKSKMPAEHKSNKDQGK